MRYPIALPGNVQSSALFLTIACLISAFTTQAAAQSQQWDTNWIPDDTFLLTSLNVQNLLNYEEEGSKTRKLLGNQLSKEAGINVDHVQQVQMIFSGVLKGDENFDRDSERLMVVKVIFSEPFNSQRILKTSDVEHEEMEVHGKKLFFPGDDSHQPSYCFPDDHTMLVGMKDGLEHVLANEQTMSGLIDRLKSADANNSDIFITFQQNETSRKFVEFISGQLDGFPFDLADIAAEAVYGDVTIQFADGKPIQASVKAKNAVGAARLQRAVDAIVGLGKTFLPTGRKAIEATDFGDFGDDSFRDFLQEQNRIQLQFLDIGEKILEGIETRTDEDTLEIDVTVMGGMGNAVTLFGRQLSAGFEMMEKQMAVTDEAIDDAADAADEVIERTVEE